MCKCKIVCFVKLLLNYINGDTVNCYTPEKHNEYVMAISTNGPNSQDPDFPVSGKFLLVHHLDYMSGVMRKQAFCICENKDADQLRCNREADQRLCFPYTDSIIPLLPKSEISNL